MPRGQSQPDQVQHQDQEGSGQHPDGPETVLQNGRHKHGEDRHGNAPAEEHPADPVGIHAEDERREGEDGEKAVVVEQPAGRRGPQSPVRQRLQRVPQPDLACGERSLGKQHQEGHKGRGHKRSGSEERCAPLPAAQQGAQERAEGDAQAQGGLVQDDGRAGAAAGHPHDDRQCCGHKQGVAQSPAGPEPDQLVNAAGQSRRARRTPR